MLSSVHDKAGNNAIFNDKTGNNTLYSRWQKVVIMLSSVDGKTGNNALYSRLQNW